MRKPTRRDVAESREAGFTLVEMVIAISVLAVVVLAASGLFESGTRALAAAKARARANDIATDGIEDLQRFSFNNLALCAPPTGPQPAGLEDPVQRDCAADPPSAFTNPCAPGTVATVPASEYNCVDNNISYSVKRYVAWVDALKTTKRLAVFVEWTDLAGNHQVSQQSSLRAPDQAAITGLAPPTFTGVSFTPFEVALDAAGHVTGSVQLNATTSTLNKAATGQLGTNIPAHSPNDQFTVQVSQFADFPSFNGFPVGIGQETFRVALGAGTSTWTVVAEGMSHHPPGTTVSFVGDKVYAEFQTIGPNGSPQNSTLFLQPNFFGSTGTSWVATLGPTTPTADDPFEFGGGDQYVSFGILRAADGKSTAAFASSAIKFCPPAGCPSVDTGAPAVPTTAVTSDTLFNAADIGSTGELLKNVSVDVTTTNVTSSDSVSLSFLTLSGSKTVLLSPKDGTDCPDSSVTTAPVTCEWEGMISKEEGYRFSSGDQWFYFAAQQVDDNVNPGSIANGSTAVAAPHKVTFS